MNAPIFEYLPVMLMKSDSPPPQLFSDAITLLKNLISTPSLSREEDKTADIIQEFLHSITINFIFLFFYEAYGFFYYFFISIFAFFI